jgi:AraC-like DNA-binding protein
MNRKLKEIKNWPELAKQTGWSASALAKLCQVSTETLRCHFQKTTGKSSRQWIAEERQKQALALLPEASSIKEASLSLGYKQQTNFTREFRRTHGLPPSKRSTAGAVHPESAKLINLLRK